MRILISLLLVLVFDMAVCQNYEIRNFDDFKSQVNEFEQKQKYSEAVNLIILAKSQFPQKKFELLKELEYIYGKTKQYEKNMDIWQEGHNEGFFFLLHKRIKKYEPYLKFSRFDSIVEKDIQLRNNAMQNAQIKYEIITPSIFNRTKKYSPIFIFHGGGSNLDKVKKHWHSTKLDSFFIKIYLQSYRYYDCRTFGWRSGDTRAYDEIKKIYNVIKNQYKIDTTKIILAGISAGGTFALDLMSHEIIPTSYFIGFCPGMPQKFTENMAQRFDNKKIFIVGGEKDYYLPKQRQLMEIFNKMQLDTQHIIVEKMGHQYPDNEGYYLDLAIDFFKMNEY